MNNKNTDFPQYRVLSNKKSWFKIENNRNFIEVQQMGTKFLAHFIEAKQYPEIVRIQDMLHCLDGVYQECSEIEYETIFEKSKQFLV